MDAKKHNKRALKKVSDVQVLFGTELGKRVLWQLMKFCRMVDNTHVKGDSHESAFLEGRRSVILWILQKQKTDLEKLDKIIEQGVYADETEQEF